MLDSAVEPVDAMHQKYRHAMPGSPRDLLSRYEYTVPYHPPTHALGIRYKYWV
jgi:hypothetical protein